MKITCMAHTDVGNQIYILSKAINQYTKHKSRCITNTEMYLDFPKDLYYPKADKDEVKDVLEDSDFYIFSQYPVLYKEYKIQLNRNNFIVSLYGTHARRNASILLKQYLKYDVLFTSRADPSYCRRIPSVIIPNSIDLEMVPNRRHLDDGKVRIVHSPTVRKIKGTELFLKVVRKLKKKYRELELVLIEGKTWKECMEIKSTCDISFDHLGEVEGIFGQNAIEGWSLRQPVLGSSSPFFYVYFPTCPLVNCTKEDLEDKLEFLLKDEKMRKFLEQVSREYVEKTHSSKVTVSRWIELIKYAMER